jgi:hypothetical protein
MTRKLTGVLAGEAATGERLVTTGGLPLDENFGDEMNALQPA